MSNFELRNNVDRIRNISVIAHIDHGKSTAVDALVCRAGLISEKDAGLKRFTDGRDDEKQRGITIKSTGVSMKFTLNNFDYLINLIDSPGHVDFSSEVTAALRVTDGALVIVDCVEGVCVQTETVLRQALAEQIKPILVINKLDRYFFELQLSPEEAYQRLAKIIQDVNILLSTYQANEDEEGKQTLLKLEVTPEDGSVLFCSAIHGWGFSLKGFLDQYAAKTNMDTSKLVKYLWGEYYFDPTSKKWVTSNQLNGETLERGFCRFVMAPLCNLINSIINKNQVEYLKVADKLNISVKITDDDWKLPKNLYKMVMKKFIPLADAILHGIVQHLPSPKQAQKYRYTTLYDGPLDDPYATAIKDCDPEGPLMLYVSKMIPMPDGGRFYAFGRVFSGTVKPGQKVAIMGSNYKYGTNEDFYTNKSIQRVVMMIGDKAETVEYVPCGNTVALVGVDQYLVKSGTVTTEEKAYPLRTMKFSVSPVVRVAVEPKNASDLPKLVEAMKKLSKSDPCVQCKVEETGEHIIAGVGELHVEICLNDLRNFMKAELLVSNPVVPLRETVTDKSSIVCLAKSPNKHNRLYMVAEPLQKELIADIQSRTVNPNDDPGKYYKYLGEKYDWDSTEARKIWCFGPTGDEDVNVIVDCTKGVQYLNEIKPHVNDGFQWASRKGVLCEEPFRGVRFNLMDVVLHADAVHRGGGQIISTARHAIYASQLTAKPALMEPIYLVEIQVPERMVGTVYSCVNHRRGTIVSEEKNPATPMCNIKAYLPVLESFGFNEYLRSQTAGQAFPQCVFDHWEIMNGDPLNPASKPAQLVKDIRKRKGLDENIPSLDQYLDKL